ncbi:MAG: hypothetical protein A3J83_06160 [Elusimicrobia bacterium RIFOXYA2_FULL_40_6]|nr:MAG: hypothetical protein A3J83_06160 [Elusimicrobia bacterium RIFOXYA2_FULL_40_6]
MKECIIEFKDLNDSSEFLNARAPNFMIWTIYIIVSILFSTLIWTWFSKMDVVVKAQGVVRPNTFVSSVLNVNEGVIDTLNFYEGKKVSQGELLYRINSKALEMQLNTINTLTPKTVTQLEMLKKLDESITTDTSLFKDDEVEYSNKYLAYKLKAEQLKLNYTRLKNKYDYEKSLDQSFTTQNKLKDMETESKYAEIAMQKEKSETLSGIKAEIASKENDVLRLKEQYNEIKSKLDLSRVTAPIEGVVQIVRNCNVGDYIPSGMEVLRIIPDESMLNVEMSVNNKDIGLLKPGQEVKYRIWALSYKEYGMLEGNILKISGDVTSDQRSQSLLFYKVAGSIPASKLVGSQGKEGFVKIGMICDASIVVRRKRILYVLLEKLNFMSS